jgi:hypothetical protein
MTFNVSGLMEDTMKERKMGNLESYSKHGTLTHINGVPVEQKGQQLTNTTLQPTANALVALSDDFAGYSMEPSEALIRAREATIAGQYVTGLDAEKQVRAGQHDDWLPLQIAYNALITKDVDVDILRKYHAPGQLALAKAEQRPVVVRARRSAWDGMMIKVARWFDIKFFNTSGDKSKEIKLLRARVIELEDQVQHKVIDKYEMRQKELQQRLQVLRLDHDEKMKLQRQHMKDHLARQQIDSKKQRQFLRDGTTHYKHERNWD